jgi:hypothetical protein
MGRIKGVKNNEGTGIYRPQINTAVGAKDSFKKLKEQKFIDENNQLTPKAERYIRAKLEELGVYHVILFENFFLKGNVDYFGIEEEEGEK